MAFDYSSLKIFSCCKKYQHSICLKIWILIFVCSLLCSTCLVIESRRSRLSERQNIAAKRAVEKLIQLRTTQQIAQEENNFGLHEESSGDDIANIEYRPEIPLIGHYLETNDNSVDSSVAQEGSHEMFAASNFISKSNGDLHELYVAPAVAREIDGDYKDFFEDIERLAYTEFSETQAQNILLDCESMSAGKTQSNEEVIDEYEWKQNLHDVENKCSTEQCNNQAIFKLTLDPRKSSEYKRGSEDRFFPDEYAFQYDYSKDDRLSEGSLKVQSHQSDEFLRETSLEELSAQEVDLPSVIESILGKVSTLFGPALQFNKPYQDTKHLANFKDSDFNSQPMIISSSKVRPVWNIKQTPHKKMQTNSLYSRKKSKVKPQTSGNTKGTHKHYNSFLKRLIDFNRNTNI